MRKAKMVIKKKKDPIYAVLGAVLAVLVCIMTVALCLTGKPTVGEFVPPAEDANAETGVPNVPDEMAYSEIYKDGMAYRLSICGVPVMEDSELVIWFSNHEDNEKYLKLRVYDEKGSVLGETGLIIPGEYVRSVTLSDKVTVGTKLRFKIMGYEPEDYSSAGSVTLNVTVGGLS